MKCKTCGTDHRGVAKHGGYCLDHQERRAEAAEACAAQLETDNDEMQGYINEIRVALHTEKDELTIEAVRRVISERDELARKLEQAQRKIDALATQLRTTPRHIQAALNEGNGVYRP